MMQSCDVTYDGISTGAAMNFNPSFGKISMGEQFRCLFTVQNKSHTHALDTLQVKTTLEKVPKGQDSADKKNISILLDVKINRLGPLEQQGFVIHFKVDSEESYNLNCDM